MKSFRQFITEARKPKNPKRNIPVKKKDRPEFYLHIGPANLKKGEDLKSMAKLYGTAEAYRRYVDKWDPFYWTGIEQVIKKYVKRVHVSMPYDLNVKPGFDPRSKSDEGFGKRVALYKITPDEWLHRKMEWDKADYFSVPHTMIKKIPAKYITHKWNVKKGTWERFN